MSIVINQEAVNTFKTTVNETIGLGIAEAAVTNNTVQDIIDAWKADDSWKGQSDDDIFDTVKATVESILPEDIVMDITELDSAAKIEEFLLDTFGEQEQEIARDGYKKASKPNEIKMKATIAFTGVERRLGEKNIVGDKSADVKNYRVVVAGQLYEATPEGVTPYIAHDLTFSHNSRYFSTLLPTVFKGFGVNKEAGMYDVPVFDEENEMVYALCSLSKSIAGETTWKNFSADDVAALGKSGKAINPTTGKMEEYVLCYHTQTSDQWSLDKVHGKANPQSVKLIQDAFMSKEDKLGLAAKGDIIKIRMFMKEGNLTFQEAAAMLNITGTQVTVTL